MRLTYEYITEQNLKRKFSHERTLTGEVMWIYSVLIILAIWQSNVVNCKLGCLKGDCDNEIREKYEPTWESLDKRPLPQWYDEAKVGIFLHWGVYSVPSFGTEWFWTNWEGQKVQTYIDFMKKNYKPGFTYHEFAKDFTAELFNATQWSLLFRDSGAKYVVLTSKHHDGYGLWPSSYSFGWNSKDVGPNLDIIKELSSSLRLHTDLKFGLYYSLFEWFNRMYLDDKRYLFTRANYVANKALPELHELISLYAPEVIWSDGDWEALPAYWDTLKFLAWLYNSSPVRDTVVTNDRWGIGTTCHHGDFYTCSDRYNPGVLQKHKWENAMTIDKTTWGNRYDTTLKDFLTTKELVSEIATTVSCGGNILINVGPNKHGTIQPIFEERLREMGNWLKVNGEAIYASKPWIYQNDTIAKGVWYTKKDDNNGRTNVYAIVLDYPYDSNSIDLHSLGGRTDGATKITLLGLPNEQIKWSTTKESLHINFPSKNIIDKEGLSLAWTFKINIPTNE